MTTTDSSATYVFAQFALTGRQRKVLDLLVDGLTSKEIAARLDLTESVINHTIDGLRKLAGGVPRAVLARNYREWRRKSDGREKIPAQGERIPLPDPLQSTDENPRNARPGVFRFEDAVILTTDTPWTGHQGSRVVPRLLDGPNAGLFRVMTIAGLLLAVLVILVLGLTAAQVLTDTLGEDRPAKASR